MRIYGHIAALVLSLILLLAWPGAVAADSADPPRIGAGPGQPDGGAAPPAGDSALVSAFQRAAGAQLQLSSADDLRVGPISHSHYPLTSVDLAHAKATDPRTGRRVDIALDQAGNVVDGEAALSAEMAARRQRLGKLDAALYAGLAAASSEVAMTFPVEIWVAATSAPPASERPLFLRAAGADKAQLEIASAAPPPTLAQVGAALQREREPILAAVAAAQAPLLAELARRGAQVDGVSYYVPLVYATLDQAAIREIAQRPDVTLIALVQRARNALDVAKLAVFADYAWDEGLTGSGVKVAVAEVNGRIATDNPYLWGISLDAENVCDDPADHATAVVGIVRSRHVRYRGISYGAQVRVGGSCEGMLSDLQSFTERALDWGALLSNHSWAHNREMGEMGADEKYWDNLVYNHRAMAVFAVGNTGRTYAEAYVNHPAMAYNVLAVGAYDDQNTVSWDDDKMADFSSYRDPASAKGDREKPELCAPGVSFNSTTVRSPWVGNTGSGTSYASPMVTGAAALVVQKAPELLAWPEAVKAILMASAVNNIELDWQMQGRDGAGGIDAQEASTKLTARGTWGARELRYADTDENDNLYIEVNVPEADRARAVIVWSVDPNNDYYPDRPDVDLDLTWLDHDGNEIVTSESYDNNFEVAGVYDVAPEGTRTLRIYVSHWVGGAIRLGWAVHYWDE
jgi:subtilisin family serine protease